MTTRDDTEPDLSAPETPESDATDTETAPNDESGSGAMRALREVMDRRKDTIERMELEVKLRAVRKLGLDPTEALGKAAMESWEPDDDGDFTVSGLEAHLSETYEYTSPIIEDPRAQAMFEAQTRTSEWGATAGSMQPTTGEDILQAHEQRMATGGTREDALAAIQAKVEFFEIGER